MNIEEKVLQMLEEMSGCLSGVESSVKRIDNSVTKLEAMPHQIQLIAETQVHHSEKLDTLQKSVEDMAPTVTALDVLHKMRQHE